MQAMPVDILYLLTLLSAGARFIVVPFAFYHCCCCFCSCSGLSVASIQLLTMLSLFVSFWVSLSSVVPFEFIVLSSFLVVAIVIADV